MWRVTLISLSTFLVVSGASVRSQEADPVKKLMSLKMDYTHQVLESLIKQDFEAIKELSFRLVVLTGTEDWMVIRTPEYSEHTVHFRRAVEAFQEAPKRGDMDAAALAYLDMTLSCVQCHKYVLEYRTTADQEK